jgi:hypothetical protein
LNIVVTYIWNAHPGVVSIYRDLDGLTKQILYGEPITGKPAEQAYHEKIRQLTATTLIPQQIEQNWQSVDCAAESRRLLEEFD